MSRAFWFKKATLSAALRVRASCGARASRTLSDCIECSAWNRLCSKDCVQQTVFAAVRRTQSLVCTAHCAADCVRRSIDRPQVRPINQRSGRTFSLGALVFRVHSLDHFLRALPARLAARPTPKPNQLEPAHHGRGPAAKRASS